MERVLEAAVLGATQIVIYFLIYKLFVYIFKQIFGLFSKKEVDKDNNLQKDNIASVSQYLAHNQFIKDKQSFFSVDGRMGLMNYLIYVFLIFLTFVFLSYVYEYYVDKEDFDSFKFYIIYFSVTLLGTGLKSMLTRPKHN